MADQVRDRILAEALSLFAHKGYGCTSVREVVEHAGVTKPTMYYYFPSKEALFREVIQTRMEALTTLVDDAVNGTGSVVVRLRTFLIAYTLGALAQPDSLRLVMSCSLPGEHDHPDVHVLTRHLANLAPLAKLIDEGIAAGELRADLDASVAVMALVGAANLHLVSALHGLPFDEAGVDRLLDTWLHGVSR